MKKQLIALTVAAAAAASCIALAACETETEETAPETVVITTLDADGEEVRKEVPYQPERVAILDYAVLDMMDSLGVGDTVVSTAVGTISYLQTYWDAVDNGDIANLGTLNSFSLETLQQSEPDIIFIGGRQSSRYAELEEIAPVVYLTVNAGTLVEDTIDNYGTIAQIFGVSESAVFQKLSQYDFYGRIETLSALSEDGEKTALNIMWTSASNFNALASDGRLSLIVNELGFTNANETYTDSQHGSSTSWEAIAEANPDYLFVMNRAFITSNDGTSQEDAKAALETEIAGYLSEVHYTGMVVVLLNPDVWYTGEGGIQALDTMLSDLESALLAVSD